MYTLYGLDWKIQFKKNNYLVFYLLMSNSAKNMKIWLKYYQKMSQNAHYFTLFDSFQHYLTLKKGICYLYETNRLICFDPIWVLNSETNTEYF